MWTLEPRHTRSAFASEQSSVSRRRCDCRDTPWFLGHRPSSPPLSRSQPWKQGRPRSHPWLACRLFRISRQLVRGPPLAAEEAPLLRARFETRRFPTIVANFGQALICTPYGFDRGAQGRFGRPCLSYGASTQTTARGSAPTTFLAATGAKRQIRMHTNPMQHQQPRPVTATYDPPE